MKLGIGIGAWELGVKSFVLKLGIGAGYWSWVLKFGVRARGWELGIQNGYWVWELNWALERGIGATYQTTVRPSARR